MPEMHSGYGFSIGAVAAFDTSDPSCAISPGGVGYGINCGVRLLTTNLIQPDIARKTPALIEAPYRHIAVGIGGKRKNFIARSEVPSVVAQGSKWPIARPYAVPGDIDNSERAIQRGADQLGTLGSGIHFSEIQVVDEIFDERATSAMGLRPKQIVVMIHTGSRGFGYQIAEDYVREVDRISDHDLPDPQLAAVPFDSDVGRLYFRAMGAAANFASCNRQIITHFVRVAFREVLEQEVQIDLVYDVAHNIAKIETHEERKVIIHRKGATRAFPRGRKELPDRYKTIGWIRR
jgi:tRNA-splicing ligase RtcB